MEAFWKNLQYAARRLGRSPGSSAVVVLILALGIGATAAVLSVIFGVLETPLPYPQPERIVRLQGVKAVEGTEETWPASYLDALDWKRGTEGLLTDFAIHSAPLAFNLDNEGKPERVDAEIVNAAYFRLLGAEPIAGRVFQPEDDRAPGSPRDAVLSHALWQLLFGDDREAVGKTLLVNEEPYRIVGVMEPGFRGISDEVDLWLPYTMSEALLRIPQTFERRGIRFFEVEARREAGVSVEDVQSRMSDVAATLAADYPDTNEHFGVEIKTLQEHLYGDLRFPLFALLGSALFVLLLACSVVATLLIARATARQHEIAVRSAQGALRRQLLGQLLSESLLLAGAGAAVGLLAAPALTRLLVGASAVEFQSWVKIGVNLPVLAVTLLLTAVASVLAGIVPAWISVRGNPALALREGRGTPTRSRQLLQSLLVGAQVALAVVLLIGAGLMIKGFVAERDQPLGVETDHLLTARVDGKGPRYAEDDEAMIQLVTEYMRELEALPGVKQAAISAPDMPSDAWFGISHIVEDHMDDETGGVRFMVFKMVTPGFFSTFGIPLVEGRDFNGGDRPDTELVAVIDQRGAERLWPGESAVGKRVRFGRRDPDAPWRTIVGVVGNVENERMQELEWPGPDIYYPIYQFPPSMEPRFNAALKTDAADPLSLAGPVRDAMTTIAPHLPPFDIDTLEARVTEFSSRDRFLVLLMAAFAGVAVLLALIGLSALVSYVVAQRRKEIGLRIALGGGRGSVMRLLVRRMMTVVAVGLAAGVAAALGLSSLFASLFFGISPVDPPVYVVMAILLGTAALLASLWATSRVFSIEPTVVLREE